MNKYKEIDIDKAVSRLHDSIVLAKSAHSLLASHYHGINELQETIDGLLQIHDDIESIQIQKRDEGKLSLKAMDQAAQHRPSP